MSAAATAAAVACLMEQPAAEGVKDSSNM